MPMAAGMPHYAPPGRRWQPKAGLSPSPSAETLPHGVSLAIPPPGFDPTQTVAVIAGKGRYPALLIECARARGAR